MFASLIIVEGIYVLDVVLRWLVHLRKMDKLKEYVQGYGVLMNNEGIEERFSG